MSDGHVVLIAEDSIVVRALLRSQLRDLGYSVIEAVDGEQALTKAGECDPDVILLDVEMPKLDGFAVMRELTRDERLADVPVIFITARTSAEDAVRGLEMGGYDYLRKPFETAELSARVQAAVRTKLLQDELRAVNARLEALAATDQLTGLGNRHYLDEELARTCSRAARHNRSLALLVIDADGFKALNDRFGHQSGDEALRGLAERLAAHKRKEDVLGRWGGEEFLLISPDIDADGAAALCERLRTDVAAHPIPTSGGHLAMTVSIGWATFRGDARDLLRRADKALYAAKAAGRNACACGDEPD